MELYPKAVQTSQKVKEGEEILGQHSSEQNIQFQSTDECKGLLHVLINF